MRIHSSSSLPSTPSATTGPALELIRSKLPRHTLLALRRVCRAARDELVDGRSTLVHPMQLENWADSMAPLHAAAPRLRRLETVSAPGIGSQRACAALGKFIARLPGAGAAVTELRIGRMRVGPGAFARPRELAKIIGGLPSLKRLGVCLEVSGGAAAKELLAAVAAGLRAAAPAARLRVIAWTARGGSRAGTGAGGAPVAPIALLPLGRLESLILDDDGAARAWLPQLFEPAAAAALTALDTLALVNGAAPLPQRPAVWRAPWLAQLTKLDFSGPVEAFDRLARALAPGALPRVRELALGTGPGASRPIPAAALDALLAACGPAARLETLCVMTASWQHVAELAARLPALSALLIGPCLDDRPHAGNSGDLDAPFASRVAAVAAIGELKAAPLAPLTRLGLNVEGHWLRAVPRKLGALLAAPWAAASLVDLELYGALDGSGGGGGGDGGSGGGGGAFPALAALAALPSLRALRLRYPHFTPAALRRVAGDVEARADAWAPRLTDFELTEYDVGAAIVRALLLLPFSRLERLCVVGEEDRAALQGDEDDDDDEDDDGDWDEAGSGDFARWQQEGGYNGDGLLDHGALLDECARALPALKSVSLDLLPWTGT